SFACTTAKLPTSGAWAGTGSKSSRVALNRTWPLPFDFDSLLQTLQRKPNGQGLLLPHRKNMTISLHRIWKPNRFRTFTPLALALLLLISPGCDATSPAENNTDTQVNDRYINVNGVELHYREWGHADAPPLVLLHGITGHAWEFDSVAAAL